MLNSLRCANNLAKTTFTDISIKRTLTWLKYGIYRLNIHRTSNNYLYTSIYTHTYSRKHTHTHESFSYRSLTYAFLLKQLPYRLTFCAHVIYSFDIVQLRDDKNPRTPSVYVIIYFNYPNDRLPTHTSELCSDPV